MKTTVRNRKRLVVWAAGMATTAAILAGCSSTSSDRTTGQKWHDRDLARGVKKELSADPTFKYENVHANVYQGNVQLTGFVETPEQRLRAAERASQVKGARQIINEIMIVPSPAGRATIRDPLGRESGRLLVDTNAAPAQLRNPPASETPSPQTGP